MCKIFIEVDFLNVPYTPNLLPETTMLKIRANLLPEIACTNFKNTPL